MNRKVLNKVLEELKKESPNIQYVLGVLETVMESLPPDGEVGLVQVTKTYKDNCSVPLDTVIPKVTDEGTSLDMQARAKMGNIALNAIKTE